MNIWADLPVLRDDAFWLVCSGQNKQHACTHVLPANSRRLLLVVEQNCHVEGQEGAGIGWKDHAAIAGVCRLRQTNVPEVAIRKPRGNCLQLHGTWCPTWCLQQSRTLPCACRRFACWPAAGGWRRARPGSRRGLAELRSCSRPCSAARELGSQTVIDWN